MYGVLFDSEAFQREVLDDAQRLLEEVSRTCKTTEVSRRAEQGPDAPAKALERVVKEEGAEFLVVGTRGRGAMRSVLMGSVAHEMLAVSPFALRLLKASFNAAEDGLSGIQQLAHDANLLFYGSEEAREGRDAYRDKRKPDFSRFPKRA